MSEQLLFAYGSLVSPASAAATLGRTIEASEPVRLPGWKRCWSTYRDNLAAEKTFARAQGGELPRYCLGLNLEPEAAAAGPNGVLLALTQADLERLDLREMRYQRTEVTESISPSLRRELRVFAYTAKPRHHAAAPPPGAVVLASYPRAVEAAFAALGADQLELYRATTDAPPVELIDAVLVEDHIPAGNPREW